MTKTVITARRDTPVEEIFTLLLRGHISGIPVVDAGGCLEGIVTELDLLQLLQNAGSTHPSVEDVWTTELVTVRCDDTLPDVSDRFLSCSLRRFPVVDDSGHLLGIISRRDIVQYIRDLRVRVAAELAAMQAAKEAQTLANA